MELLALLSNNDAFTIPEVKAALKRYTVYPLKTVEELEDLYTTIPLNLILIDTVSHRLSSLSGFLQKFNEDTAILITPEKLDIFTLDNLPPSVYDHVEAQSIQTELPAIIERALEKQRLKNEIAILKKTKKAPPLQEEVRTGAHGEAIYGHRGSLPYGKYLQEKILVNFAKMLTASFDTKKLFNHFMDSVMGIVRINKMSVMLRDEEGFSVKVHIGLDPYLAEHFTLKRDSAFVTWLAKTGRIMQKPEYPVDSASINIKSEMDVLQASFSFPLMHKGKLIGIFNIDNKITEEPFYREELEIIYVFCNYLAAAVKDINLYHQIWYQKEFTRNILSSMNSGVIAIDRDEKITIFNQQAAAILDSDPSKMVGKDLRNLPSPLGDILFETMVTGTSYKRYEVEIGPTKVPLGINSCALRDKNQNPVGAGIIFTDLSDSKKLEEQKRRAEKLEAINNLVAKIAHEVRTPLTSIQTYTQILSEKYKGDEELQNFFASTVIQSIHQLDSLMDKLVIFSSSSDYNFQKEDVNLVLSEAAEYVTKNIPGEYKFLNQGVEGTVLINADKKLLIKGIYYLIINVIGKVKKDTFITMSAKTVMKDPPRIRISIEYSGEEITEGERQNLLKPLQDINSLGTELNVPISYKIIEGHKGSINIESAKGTNAFIIDLPSINRRSPTVPTEEKTIE